MKNAVQKRNPVRKRDIIKLGALECTSGCLVNGLRILRKNIDYFYINFWSTTYSNGLVTGSRRIDGCFMDFIFGISLEMRKGDIDEITRHIENNELVLLNGPASKFYFFPEEFLGEFENIGFGHTVLLHKYDETREHFLAVDSIVDCLAALSKKQMEPLKDENGKFTYFLMADSPEDFRMPDKGKIILQAVNRNHRLFDQNLFNFGIRSLNSFRNDFVNAANGDKEKTFSWILNNCISIYPIHKNRMTVWKSFKRLKWYTGRQKKILKKLVAKLCDSWKRLHDSLEKYREDLDNIQLHTQIVSMIDDVKDNELEVLGTMKNFAFMNEAKQRRN